MVWLPVFVFFNSREAKNGFHIFKMWLHLKWFINTHIIALILALGPQNIFTIWLFKKVYQIKIGLNNETIYIDENISVATFPVVLRMFL